MEEEKIFEKRWQLASSEQRARYNNLMSSYPTVDLDPQRKEVLALVVLVRYMKHLKRS